MINEVTAQDLGLPRDWRLEAVKGDCPAGCNEPRNGRLGLFIPGVIGNLILTPDGFLAIHSSRFPEIAWKYKTAGIELIAKVGHHPCIAGEHQFWTWSHTNNDKEAP